MGWGIARLVWVAAACAATGCGATAPRGAPPAPSVASARYEVHVASTAPWVLAVDLTVLGGADRLLAGDVSPAAIHSVQVDVGASSSAPERVGAEWPIECRAGCMVHYRVDLSEVARASGDDPAIALRSGADLVAPASSWLLRPEPLTSHVPILVVVYDAPGVRFASGFAALRECSAGEPQAPGERAPCAGRSTFELRSQELRTAGYAAFGSFAPLRAKVHGGAIDIAVLGGERAVEDDAVVRWVGRMAATLDPLFGRFPVPRVQLFLVPEPGAAAPLWGRTLPSGGLSILLKIGSQAGEDDLNADWILVHEMIHLGVPSFWREGRWLDEGLATYYGPVLRARAGLRSELDLWTEFATQMPRGLGEPGDPSLAQATLHSRVYWGGASFMLRADALIRSRTGGAKSLDDGIREALERGADATRIWSLDAYLGAIDSAVTVPVMRELFASVAARDASPRTRKPGAAQRLDPLSARLSPEAAALFGLLRDLGVERGSDGTIALRSSAPLSQVRHGIAHARD